MTISSMTGFARANGALEFAEAESAVQYFTWQWEVKSVNGKALDLRFKFPQGFEGLELSLRKIAQNYFKRGNLQVSLNLTHKAQNTGFKINKDVLENYLAVLNALPPHFSNPSKDGLLALRGVVETATDEISEELQRTLQDAVSKNFEDVMQHLKAARDSEGEKILAVLEAQLARIAELKSAIANSPARKTEAIKEKLQNLVAKLMDAGSFDADKLHQEAVLQATRIDVQEELDRLQAHIDLAKTLLAEKDAANGRKLDFLAQEFNREANTICSKSSDNLMIHHGLELKAVIDQMREQVQNIE